MDVSPLHGVKSSLQDLYIECLPGPPCVFVCLIFFSNCFFFFSIGFIPDCRRGLSSLQFIARWSLPLLGRSASSVGVCVCCADRWMFVVRKMGLRAGEGQDGNM